MMRKKDIGIVGDGSIWLVREELPDGERLIGPATDEEFETIWLRWPEVVKNTALVSQHRARRQFEAEREEDND